MAAHGTLDPSFDVVTSLLIVQRLVPEIADDFTTAEADDPSAQRETAGEEVPGTV